MSKMYFLPFRPAFDSAGITVPGSQHWFTLAGTNTPSAPFTDATLATPLENPLVSNGIGYLPPVYLNPAISYRVRIYDENAEVGVDVPLEEYDPYVPALANTDILADLASAGGFELVNQLPTGAVGDGVADELAALQAAANGAERLDLPAGTFKLSGPIGLSANAKFIGAGRGVTVITMTADADMVTINGSAVEIRGVSFLHTGNGRIVNASHDDDLVIEECELQATSAAATSSLIECSGSFLALRRNVITNNRTGAGAYALKLDRTTGALDIESHIQQNRIAGNGRGLWIGSSDNSARPEGINMTDNSLFCLMENLTIEQLLQASVTSNVFDQTNDKNIILKPVNTGIQNVEIGSNYIATPNQLTTGTGIYHDNTNPASPLGNLSIINNSFSFCGTGARFRTPANAIIAGNTFASIGTANLDIADGASGGPFIIDANAFDTAKPVTLTVTAASKFILGAVNSGRKLSGWSSTATDTTAKASGSTITIPHGLSGTPDKAKIVTSIVGNVAVFSAATQPIVTAVDGTNITVLVTYTAGTPGTYTVNAWASL